MTNKTTRLTWEILLDNAPKLIIAKLEQAKILRERPDFHPEPNCYTHIKIVTERLISTGDVNLALSGLFHDICKIDTVKINEKTGHPTCPGHDAKAFYLITENDSMQKFISDMGADPDVVARICKQHMRIKQMSKMKERKQNLLREMDIFPLLEVFTMADNMLKDFVMDNEKERLIKSFYVTNS